MSVNSSFQNNYPFVSCIKSNDIEYVGIIINFDNYIASIYDISVIKTDDEKRVFLELGEIWWWESNRKIPINIFLKKEMQFFRYSIKTFNSKDTRVVLGPVVNLMNLTLKRVKRKSVQLVRKVR